MRPTYIDFLDRMPSKVFDEFRIIAVGVAESQANLSKESYGNTGIRGGRV